MPSPRRERIGFPVVAKLNGDKIAHKTERGLVRLRLGDGAAVERAAAELLAAARDDDGEVTVLVAPMVSGNRELIVGLIRDPQFGATVMLGVGGMLAEAVADVVFRPAPLDDRSATGMIDDLATQKLLGEFRGERAVDRAELAAVLVGLGRLAGERPDVLSVDINPLIVQPDGSVIAVDGLVEIDPASTVGPMRRAGREAAADRRAVPGALRAPRRVRSPARRATPASSVSSRSTTCSPADTPEGSSARTSRVRKCSASRPSPTSTTCPTMRSISCSSARRQRRTPISCAPARPKAFVPPSSPRRATARPATKGAKRNAQLVALADELGILLAGPNGQGVVSTPANLCAQIVAPYPPAGHIGVASQSGNFVSTFLNLSRLSGVGISRAVSAGNAAAVTVADYLGWYATDDVTTVGLAYVEGINDGRGLMDRLAVAAAAKPLVLVKGGATEGGAHAAASHTGALAANDKIFDGECRAAGITRAGDVTEAFEAAATFATQPLPKGPNTVVLTTAGGWGVVTADAITRDGDLVLMELPADLQAAIDEKLPPRWSRNNPVDCAGGETRDTIPEVLELIASHPEVDAVIYLGHRHPVEPGADDARGTLLSRLRSRANRRLSRAPGRPLRRGGRRPRSCKTGKPILVATELALADPDNAGPAALRARGRLCYPSGERAARALGHLVRDAAFRRSAKRVNEPVDRRPPTPPRRSTRQRARPADRPRSRRAGAGAGALRHPSMGRRPDHRVVAGARGSGGQRPAGDPAHVADVHDAADVDGAVAGAVDRHVPHRCRRLRTDLERSIMRRGVDRRRAGGIEERRPRGDTGEHAEIARRRRGARPARRRLPVLDGGRAPAAHRSSGTVAGDLYLVGGGDPVLSSDWYPTSNMERYPVTSPTRLEALADGLVSAGVTSITGDVVGDASRYDDEYFAPSWAPGVAGLEAGPYDALMANDSRVLFEPLKSNDPAQGAAQEFVRMLTERGITVGGSAVSGVAPTPTVELAAIQSAPLADIVGEMLANSDNNTAELLVKELGFDDSGTGTREAGLAVIERTLAEWAVDTAPMVFADGSGSEPRQPGHVHRAAVGAATIRSRRPDRCRVCRSPDRPARCRTSSSTIRSPADCSARRAH